ncbi:MAG: two-component sensor histidine kinase [Lachnospiraceae bacterium]|nr:two-component sensor histidine kinase [Lachnospiraceae bacterium]MBQ2577774.1 two-component sensor histidine kinase [Lachnospiraceae bacterium]MCR4732942.1 cell wall metabolism sensor histidine kinase WalK [Lachnospiraceae bacterium]MEE3355866.1 HAMP domain-containing sensor histidine kinase [Candidatus Weimeria sp.]
MKRFSLPTVFNSLRVRIFVLVLLIGWIPGSLIGGLFFQMYQKKALSNDAVSMTSQAQLLSNQIVTTGYLSNPDMDAINNQLMALGNIYSGRVMILNSSLQVINDTYDIYTGRTMVWQNAILALRGRRSSTYDDDSHCQIIAVPIMGTGAGSTVEGVIVITKSTDYLEQNVSFYTRLLLFSVLVSGILATIVALFSSSYLTDPLRKLSAAILNRQNSGEQVMVSDVAETTEISKHFNEVMTRMDEIDASRQEFVSNVSHELKTPLTSMKVLADSLTSMGDEVPVELYRDFMDDITHEIDRETKIINDLLSLVRMDKSGVTLNIEAKNINEMLEQLMKRLRPIAEKNQVELVMESFRPVTAEVDEVKFSLAIMNLIENGIKYNQQGGFVHVSLNADHQYFFIRVEDCGMGIPQDSLNRIFERFYRVDKSHSREIGGTGLGLAITKNAIDMHHGQIQVHSMVGEGTTFDVRVPLSYIKES